MDAPEKQPVSWQKRKELGAVKALLQTIKEVLLAPAKFFEHLDTKRPYFETVFFAIPVVLAVMAISLTLSVPFSKEMTVAQYPLTLIILLVAGTISIPLMLFIGAAFMHLVVLLFGGKGGYKGTFDILAYSSATSIFSFIPFIGPLVSGIWGIIVIVNGYKQVHKLGTVKAFFAYFAPLLVAIPALLAAIAIPNLLRARLLANESATQASLKMIAAAAENYAADNEGRYPSDEYDLKYATPSYIDNIYNNITVNGYIYSSDMGSAGYKVTATPSECGVTGSRIFTIETKGGISEQNCRQQP